MKVFISCTIKNLLNHPEEMTLIREIVLGEGYPLARDWMPEVLDAGLEAKAAARNQVYSEVMKAIQQADLCIFDFSIDGSSVGFQLAHALNRGKPTLLVKREQVDSDRIEQYFITGCKSGYLKTANYSNTEQLKQVVKSFLDQYADGVRMRFNLALSKDQMDFIVKRAQEEGKNKTEVISEAIDQIRYQEL